MQTTITGKSHTFYNTDIESLIVIVHTSHICEALESLRSVQALDINACTALQYSTALVYNTYIIEDNGNTETFLLPESETG